MNSIAEPQRIEPFSFKLAKLHYTGFVPQHIGSCTQYKELHIKGTVISVNCGDNCACLADDIVLVQNIISVKGQVKFVCQKFSVKSNFFTYPLNSSLLGVLLFQTWFMMSF